MYLVSYHRHNLCYAVDILALYFICKLCCAIRNLCCAVYLCRARRSCLRLRPPAERQTYIRSWRLMDFEVWDFIKEDLVLTPQAGAFVPSGQAPTDGTILGSSSRLLACVRGLITCHQVSILTGYDRKTKAALDHPQSSKCSKSFTMKLFLLSFFCPLNRIFLAWHRALSSGSFIARRFWTNFFLHYYIEFCLIYFPLFLNLLLQV